MGFDTRQRGGAACSAVGPLVRLARHVKVGLTLGSAATVQRRNPFGQAGVCVCVCYIVCLACLVRTVRVRSACSRKEMVQLLNCAHDVMNAATRYSHVRREYKLSHSNVLALAESAAAAHMHGAIPPTCTCT